MEGHVRDVHVRKSMHPLPPSVCVCTVERDDQVMVYSFTK